MNYAKLEPIPREMEAGIIEGNTIYFHSPSNFSKEFLYYPHFGGMYTCRFPYRVKRDFCDTFLLARIIKGRFHIRFMDQYFAADEGSVVFLDCKKPHIYWAEDPVTFQWIHFDGCSTQGYFDYLFPLRGVVFPDKPELFFQFNYLLEELKSDLSNDHKLSFLIHNILGLLAMNDKKQIPSSVTESIRFMTSHFQENLSVEDIAANCALNPQYFSRLFKKHTGQPPHQYLLSLRMKRAKSLLIESPLSVNEIANECGFTSSTHFIRSFKAENSITPQMFRKYFDPRGFRS
ncbi:MAG: AraC family transcriptional regulator [Ruminococcus sp.]|jgi:AraC family transcriptional regulator